MITGFLGVGKTSAILHLLAHKPADQRWAVLVNEFGEIGIDGALMKDSGAFIKEVPGGCMCCSSNLPTQMALNLLIKQAAPDRILIEPTGLGHPERVIAMLREPHYRSVLDLRATVCLVDPRKLSDSRYRENPAFTDQIALSDVLVANRCDLCSGDEIEAFYRFATESQPPKARIALVVHGAIDVAWLDAATSKDRRAIHPEAHAHPHGEDHTHGDTHVRVANARWDRVENRGDGFFSCGWRFEAGMQFEIRALERLFSREPALRMKGVFHTDEGWQQFNAADGSYTARPCVAANASIIEAIDRSRNWESLERGLLDSLVR
ncbi:MAG: GTP-binding protein [Spirochaetaceae bacterium]|nr:MAG: GTP-binding protein [Spirochaetaceae bacterium]